MSNRGLTLVEVVVVLGLTAVLLYGVASFIGDSQREMSRISAASAIENEFSVASGAIQSKLATSLFYRVMASNVTDKAAVRAVIPLIDKCRNNAECEGSISLFFVSPASESSQSLAIREVTVLESANGRLELFFSTSADLTAFTPGSLIGLLNLNNAPLFRVVIGSQAANKNTVSYKKITVLPLTLPSDWIGGIGSKNEIAVWNDVEIGALILPFNAYILGPKTRTTQIQKRSSSTLGLQKCVISSSVLNCTLETNDKYLVDIESLLSFQIAASFKRPLYGRNDSAICNNTQVFYDLLSPASLPSCTGGAAELSTTMKFENPTGVTDAKVQHMASNSESKSYFDPTIFSTFKFEILNSLRFQIQLSRPDLQKSISAENQPREVNFYANFL